MHIYILSIYIYFCFNLNIYIYILVKFIVPSGTKETISGKMVIESWYVAMH